MRRKINSLIKKQDRRVSNQRSRDSDFKGNNTKDASKSAPFLPLTPVPSSKLTPLFLPPTQTSLPHFRIHPIGQSPNEITVRLPRGDLNLLLGRSRRSVGDVLSDGSVEERRILGDDTELVAPGGGGEVADVWGGWVVVGGEGREEGRSDEGERKSEGEATNLLRRK